DDAEKQLVRAACASAAVTHAHPLGQDGAVLVALTAAFASNDLSLQEISRRLRRHVRTVESQTKLAVVEGWLRTEDHPVAPRRAAAELGNGIKAADSCVTAVYIGLVLLNCSFSQLMQYILQVGGDVDTIGSMAGAIWGAAGGRGRLPEKYLRQLEQRERIEQLATNFADYVAQR
ncbi:MAG: hypothetical protein D3924_19595, partial [Candidatus Electrothrix sp. AR4]|nr:hypothetical protein [Candidatus Electrothrix sp. AR4]